VAVISGEGVAVSVGGRGVLFAGWHANKKITGTNR